MDSLARMNFLVLLLGIGATAQAATVAKCSDDQVARWLNSEAQQNVEKVANDLSIKDGWCDMRPPMREALAPESKVTITVDTFTQDAFSEPANKRTCAAVVHLSMYGKTNNLPVRYVVQQSEDGKLLAGVADASNTLFDPACFFMRRTLLEKVRGVVPR